MTKKFFYRLLGIRSPSREIFGMPVVLDPSAPKGFIGIDYARGPDNTIISGPCGNCGIYRVIQSGVMEKCPNCGDDETDLNEEIQIP